MARGGYVLVADSDAKCRAKVVRLFERLGYETREAASAEAALAAATEERPALVVLEVNLPDLSGYEVCRELRDTLGEGLPILFVSEDRTEPFDRVAGLLLGADDYLVKPFAPDELLARARRLLPGRARTASASSRNLTLREVEVLQLLAEGMGQKQIASWLVISPKTVATHVEHILTKLGVHSRAEAVAAAYREGLVRIQREGGRVRA